MKTLSDFLANRAVKKVMNNPLPESSLENEKNGTISTDENGIRIENTKRDSVTINWASIQKIHAYKVDLFTVDLICFSMEFEAGAQTRKVEIHEEMVGFSDLSVELENRLEGVLKNWYLKVALPAFDTNYIVIWENPNNALERNA